MSLLQTMTIYELLDDPQITGEKVVDYFSSYRGIEVRTQTVNGEEGSTDFVKFLIPGTNGQSINGNAPTLGIIGRLGGIGARPSKIGIVSDADGAVAAISAALKLAIMHSNGDKLVGDVIITTHICPDAPTIPHEPVDFMGSPVDIFTMNQYEVDPKMDAILSIDTTKGNKVINHKGIALSPTVLQGYILRMSDDLLRINEVTTGELPVAFPITTQDITPYGNGIYHINSILQPSIATSSPVVGVAITTTSTVPGSSSGASHEIDIAKAVKFAIEVAKEYTAGSCHFYDQKEFKQITALYGSMEHLQTKGALN